MPRTEREKISDGSANAWLDIRLTFGRLVNVSISLTCMYLVRVKNIWRPCKHAVHGKVSCSRSEELFSQTPNEVRDWISSWSNQRTAAGELCIKSYTSGRRRLRVECATGAVSPASHPADSLGLPLLILCEVGRCLVVFVLYLIGRWDESGLFGSWGYKLPNAKVVKGNSNLTTLYFFGIKFSENHTCVELWINIITKLWAPTTMLWPNICHGTFVWIPTPPSSYWP